jgi:hypothetical protein
VELLRVDGVVEAGHVSWNRRFVAYLLGKPVVFAVAEG